MKSASSPLPEDTEIPPPPPPSCDAEYLVHFYVTTWEDVNHDGKRDKNEPPLPGIQVHLDYVDSIWISDVSDAIATDADGSAKLEILVGGPCGSDTYTETITKMLSIEVTATTPPECKLTTPGKLSVVPYQFGFWCTGTPSPPVVRSAPTDTPRPTATVTKGSQSLYGNPLVAYTGWVGKGLQIFAANLDKDPLKIDMLTQETMMPYLPVWSPDGTKIAYFLYDTSTKQDFFKLYDILSGETRQLSSQAVSMRGSHVYCWTFDQKYLIWGDHQPDGAEMDIYRLDVATGEIVDLTQESAVWDAFPACSPVNDQIAFVSDRQGSSKENDNIWVMDSQGENLKQVTNTQTMFWENQFPGWSPDGSEIAFFRFSFTEQDQNGPPGIWAVKPDGSGERLVIEIKDLAEFNRKGTPIWSPDGKYIAYSIGKGERNIYIVPTSGGELLWRCDLPGVNSEVSWSANSKHLIFTNSLNDIARIYIVAIDDLKPAPLLPDPGNFVGMFGPGKKQ